MIRQLGIKIFAVLLVSSAITFASTMAVQAHGGHGGGHSSGSGIVPVHGSPSLNGGILVTHGNLHLPPPPVNIVRDHRPGHFNWYCRHDPLACAPGGVLGGTPAIPPYGGLPQGGTVRDHRH